VANTELRKAEINSQIDGGERWVFERSPISLVFEYFILALLVYVAIDLTARYDWLTQNVNLGIPLELSLPMLLPIIYFGFIVHQLKNSIYSISAEQVRATHGRLSFSKQDTEIDVIDVRGVEIRRPLLGRLFNYGSVEIGTAAHQGEEILMRGVADPSCVRDIILHYKERAVQKEGSETKKSTDPAND
jgi:hypothetical protein